jgi:hypothetical protein
MTFEEFTEMLDREKPATISSGLVSRVHPVPWILRAGHGNEARIRMTINGGEHRYEREPGEAQWHRVERSEFDVLDDAA